MSYNQEIIFHLPGVFEKIKVNQVLIWLYKNRPEFFKENVKIGSFYGSPGVIWNGGRFIGGYFTKKELESIRDFMKDMNIPIRFTFSNCLIEEKHLSDIYGNLILEIFNNGKNEILCNSSILEKYIREKYNDNYKYISSTTKRLNKKEDQKLEILKDYYLIVLDYDYNNDNNFLKELDSKEKIEILCNAVCQSNCPKRLNHYKNISYCQLNYDPDSLFACEHESKSFKQTMELSHFITVERINELLELGFKNFKLEGRTGSDEDLADALIYYLIKDEWQDFVKEELLK